MSKKNITCLLVGLLLSAVAQATTVYVSDVQFVAIRQGQDNNSPAVERGIKSGTPLQVLEKSNGYTKVKTPSGNVGWVADYFLSDDQVTREQVIQLQEQLTKLSQSKVDLNKQYDESQQNVAALTTQVSNLEKDKAQLTQQLASMKALTDKAKTIVEKNDNVAYQIDTLKQQLAAAKAQAKDKGDSNQQKWFAIGAGTLLGGVLIGILIPLTRRKKTSSGTWV
ncbi:TIGR04211 family SH3 domain-containing protein [Marinomonas spartinae]|uniref:TIGR04211 family SH3 domain-containing protein n=1 Tax=Marinomonas spartinae TaxID=1792290 RepID=UPI0018F24B88|nr:TIGR04211 family SH3 domain-containing protein [Marinomonas spartinae]MBJ7554723.1 TIGR04211 family SH3 domain-containing protein [Marinomonas spartinae]